MKTKTVFLFLLISNLLFSQNDAVIKDSVINVLVKHIKNYGGDKYHYSSFKLFKSLTDSFHFLRDTIYVGYYGWESIDFNEDTFLLKIEKWENNTFKFPTFKLKNNYEKVIVKQVSLDFWSKCEEGVECPELQFVRNKNDKKIFILIPCGGSFTSIFVYDNAKIIEEKNYDAESCPPWVDLTNYTDGKYTIRMTSCGLGGAINFNLKTK